MTTEEQKLDMLAHRKENFAVEVTPPRDPLYENEVILRITHNGYQYSAVTLLPHEANAVAAALLAAFPPAIFQ